jgi:hypothetical protein
VDALFLTEVDVLFLTGSDRAGTGACPYDHKNKDDLLNLFKKREL